MPIKKCSINGKPGFKYGDTGKCYTGPSGRNKARNQGIAEIISGYENIIFKANRISFDYDGTLSTLKGKELAKLKISQGNILYIISARHSIDGMLSTAKELGIPTDRIYATGSNKAKVEKVLSLGIDTHYDNNQDVINELKGIGKIYND